MIQFLLINHPITNMLSHYFINLSNVQVTLACVASLLRSVSILLRNLAIRKSQMSLTKVLISSAWGMSSVALKRHFINTV